MVSWDKFGLTYLTLFNKQLDSGYPFMGWVRNDLLQ